MAVNSYNELPKAKKTCGGVNSIPLNFRIILTVGQRSPEPPIKTRCIEVS
jgi:hypothetical protein